MFANQMTQRLFSSKVKDSGMHGLVGYMAKARSHQKEKMVFKNIKYDQEGRLLLLHHHGAKRYLIMNVGALSLFLGVTLYNYVKNPQVFFGKKWLANTYLFLIVGGLLGTWVFGNRQIRSLYLLRGGETVGIETYSNFGLTYNRLREVPVKDLQGNRLFGTKAMNLYQLEYTHKSTITGKVRSRSFFYRPEYIEDAALWKAVRNGNEVMAEEDLPAEGKEHKILKGGQKLAKKKSKGAAMYR